MKIFNRQKKKKIVNLLMKNYIISFILMMTLLIASAFTFLSLAYISYDLVIGNSVTASAFFKDNYKDIPYKDITSKHGFAYVYDTNSNLLEEQHSKKNFDFKKYNPASIFSIVYKDGFNPDANTNFTIIYENYILKSGYNRKHDYILIVGYPKKSTDFFATRNRKVNFKVFSIICIIICTILFFIIFLIYSRITARYFIKPVNTLKEGAEKFASGDYSSRIILKTQNEFKDLGDTLNLMASRISEEKILKEKAELSRKRLILDVSHDLKNPLSNIMGYSDYLINNDLSQEDIKKYLKIIQNNSIRANDLIQNLFEFSKLDSADFKLDLKETDICEFMREIIAFYIPSFDSKKFNYNFDIPKESIIAAIDEKQFDRAISNIISNSLKYNTAGTTMSISLFTKNDLIYIIIEDDGIGISKSRIDTIFDPFVRVDESRNSNSGGTGLGLSISKSIIDKHHGKITLTSDTNKGCKFVISLKISANSCNN